MDDVAANRAMAHGLVSYPHASYRATGSFDRRTPDGRRDPRLAAATPPPVHKLGGNGSGGLSYLLAIVVAIVLIRWHTLRPQEVSLTQATVTTITETIASSGRVRGVTETVVGAPSGRDC